MPIRSKPVEVRPGVLSRDQIEQLFNKKAITSASGGELDIDASAFDLRLGKNVWQLKEGHRPASEELQTLLKNSKKLSPEKDAKGQYFSFRKKNIYLVKLDNYLNLPTNICGRATGKSSIGRLDVITRLLTENNREYDVVEMGYRGELYLLVVPQTFSIKIPINGKLNQLRLFSGPPHASVVTRPVINSFGTPFWFIRKDSGRGYQRWRSLLKGIQSPTADPNLFDLRVDLADLNENYIFAAKPQTSDIDIRKGPNSYDPKKYFDRINIKKKGSKRSVVLDEGKFYIMKSKERLYIPPDVAVEVIAISERIGDIRIHYAGFAHPCFGRSNSGNVKGTPLIFEVRATDMATRISDGSLLARIQLFWMSRAAEKVEPSPYDKQELKLSSYFKEW